MNYQAAATAYQNNESRPLANYGLLEGKKGLNVTTTIGIAMVICGIAITYISIVFLINIDHYGDHEVFFSLIVLGRMVKLIGAVLLGAGLLTRANHTQKDLEKTRSSLYYCGALFILATFLTGLGLLFMMSMF